MIDLPMRGFCLHGANGERIELTIDEVDGFPASTSIEGGYDFTGRLDICIGSYEVHCKNFLSSTGILYRMLTGLERCYSSLDGTAEYAHLYENHFQFKLAMTSWGHAEIDGFFEEFGHLSNHLTFEMETDQTCILEAVNSLKKVETLFGDHTGKRIK